MRGRSAVGDSMSGTHGARGLLYVERPAARRTFCLPISAAVAVFKRKIGIRFNGREHHDAEEYCISEGWVEVSAGRTPNRKRELLLQAEQAVH
jgi:hypothetical protein